MFSVFSLILRGIAGLLLLLMQQSALWLKSVLFRVVGKSFFFDNQAFLEFMELVFLAAGNDQ